MPHIRDGRKFFYRTPQLCGHCLHSSLSVVSHLLWVRAGTGAPIPTTTTNPMSTRWAPWNRERGASHGRRHTYHGREDKARESGHYVGECDEARDWWAALGAAAQGQAMGLTTGLGAPRSHGFSMRHAT